MQRFGGYDSNILLFVSILGKVQTVTLRAAAMVYGIEPKEFSFPITKHTARMTISTSTEKDGNGKLQEESTCP